MKTAWLLAGAGAKGIVQCGMVKALLDAGLNYDILFGASAGALNGALLHQGGITAMQDLWMNIRSKDVRSFAPWKAMTKEACFYDNAPLRKLIDKYIEPAKIRANNRPFGFSVTDLSKWESRVNIASRLTDDQMKQQLYISASPPILTPLQNLGNQILTDGGMVNDFGIAWAEMWEADLMIVLMPTVPKPPKIRTVIDVIDSLLEVALYCYMQREIETSEKQVIVIQPDKPLDIGVLDFDYKWNRQDLINCGRSLTNKVLPKIYSAIQNHKH